MCLHFYRKSILVQAVWVLSNRAIESDKPFSAESLLSAAQKEGNK